METKERVLSERDLVQSVGRAVAIMELFCEIRPELSLTEISGLMDLHKSTVYSILSTLVQRGYVIKNPESSKYKLGLKLFELGKLVQDGIELKVVAEPFMKQLVLEHGETTHLVTMDEDEVFYIDKKESPQSIRIISQIGRRLPAHCTGVGKILLAHLPEKKVRQILQKKGLKAFTPNTITDMDKLLEHLQMVLKNGYALDDQEFTEGLKCVAAPVFDYRGRAIAAISISGPAVRLDREVMPHLVENILKATGGLSERLGYRRLV